MANLVDGGVRESSFVRGKAVARWKQATGLRGGEAFQDGAFANTVLLIMMMSVALARALTDAEQMDPLEMHHASRWQVIERRLDEGLKEREFEEVLLLNNKLQHGLWRSRILCWLLAADYGWS